MKPASKARPGMTVGRLVLEGLKATKHSTDELAEAIHLPAHYITELIQGRRKPPLPSRTDVYDRMTRFLRLGRTDLADCAVAERAESGPDLRSPTPVIRDQFLLLCDADTARKLKRRAQSDDAEMVDLLTRVLAVVQGNARRSLDSEIPLRVAATRSGDSYPALRLRVIEFLDCSPATLTEADLAEFVRPQISRWDVDLESGVLRVVLHSAGSNHLHQRRPHIRLRAPTPAS